MGVFDEVQKRPLRSPMNAQSVMAKKRTTNQKVERRTQYSESRAKPPSDDSDSAPTTSVKLRQQPKVILASDLASASTALQSGHIAPELQYAEAPSVNLKFKDTIRVINRMLEAGIIGRYAVGGAVGATFYLEPVRTADVDIFVPIHREAGRLIVTLDPFSDYLKKHGYSMKDEYWEIEGTLVQFMPVEGDELLLEAISQPRKFEVEGVPTFVFSPEHLAAIALKVGRIEKDVPRLQQFIREQKLNRTLFLEILKRHALVDAWNRFKGKYLVEEK
jgi:hypothetical protein